MCPFSVFTDFVNTYEHFYCDFIENDLRDVVIYCRPNPTLSDYVANTLFLIRYIILLQASPQHYTFHESREIKEIEKVVSGILNYIGVNENQIDKMLEEFMKVDSDIFALLLVCNMHEMKITTFYNCFGVH